MALAALGADEIAGGKHADAGDLEIGRDHAAAIGGVAAGEMPRQHPRLLIGRLDQPVADAAMLGAFAEREDIRRAGLQMIVDHDAAIDGNAGLFRQRDIGPDAGGENHRVGLEPAAVGQFDAFDPRLAVDARGVGVEQDLDALALDQRFQQCAPPAHRAGAPSAGPSDGSASPARRPWPGHRRPPVPSNPPPTTTTRFFCAASASSRSTSRVSRKVCTPARSAPGTLSRSARRAGGEHQPRKRDALFVGDLEFAAADIDLGGDGSHISG